MSRKRLTWSDRAASPLFSKGRRASGAPALPNEGFGHPAGYEDPDMHKYETGDPSSWAEDPYEGEIRTSPAPALPVDDGGYRHPATLEGSPMRNASLYKKAALRVRLAEMLFKGKNSKIANDEELSATFVQHQATELMDVPDDIITAAIRRIEAATLSEATLARKLYAEENGEDPSEVEEEEEEDDSVAAKKAAYRRALANSERTSSKRAALRHLVAEEEEEEEEDKEASKKASRIARLRQLIAKDEEEEEDAVASKKAAKLRKLIAEEEAKKKEEEVEKMAARRLAAAKRLAQVRKAEEEKAEEKAEEKKEDSPKEAAQRVAALRKLLASEEAKLKAAAQKKAFDPMAEIASLRAELEALKSGGRHAEISTSVAEMSDEAMLDETLAEFGLESEETMGEETMGEEMMAESDTGMSAGGYMADDYSDIIIGDGADQMGFSDPSMTDEDDELLGSLFASKNASEEEEEEEEEKEKEASKKANTQRTASARTAALRPQPKKQSMTRTASAQGVSNELANLWDSPPSLEAVLGSMPTTKMNRR